MDFQIYTNTRFREGVSVYLRLYQAVIKRNGLIKIKHIRTGEILFDNLDPATITIAGAPMQSLNDLQEIIFNMGCACLDTPDEDIKIFDLSFDITFE